MHKPSYLLVPLLEAFSWFDSGLQAYLKETGWSEVTRPQTMVLVTVGLGARRPAEIARRLSITRQSVGKTIAEMIDQGLLEFAEDPVDRRAKIVTISALGERRRADSRRAIRLLTKELSKRIGQKNVDSLTEVMRHDWGDPVLTFKIESPSGQY